MSLDVSEIFLRLGLAAVFGGIIGFERERKDWAAGLRTHMMVCLGSTLMMIVSAYGFEEVLSAGKNNVDLDPSRIAGQVVSGIGFIGAGTILFLKSGVVRGLTTAAGLWTVAGIGLATGVGMYGAAGGTTVLAVIVLWALKPIEKYLPTSKDRRIRVTAKNRNHTVDLVDRIFSHEKVQINSMSMSNKYDKVELWVEFKSSDRKAIKRIVTDLQADEGVEQVVWNV